MVVEVSWFVKKGPQISLRSMGYHGPSRFVQRVGPVQNGRMEKQGIRFGRLNVGCSHVHTPPDLRKRKKRTQNTPKRLRGSQDKVKTRVVYLEGLCILLLFECMECPDMESGKFDLATVGSPVAISRAGSSNPWLIWVSNTR